MCTPGNQHALSEMPIADSDGLKDRRPESFRASPSTRSVVRNAWRARLKDSLKPTITGQFLAQRLGHLDHSRHLPVGVGEGRRHPSDSIDLGGGLHRAATVASALEDTPEPLLEQNDEEKAWHRFVQLPGTDHTHTVATSASSNAAFSKRSAETAQPSSRLSG